MVGRVRACRIQNREHPVGNKALAKSGEHGFCLVAVGLPDDCDFFWRVQGKVCGDEHVAEPLPGLHHAGTVHVENAPPFGVIFGVAGEGCQS